MRRRTDTVGILPNRDAIVRPVGAVLPGQTDEWAEGRRYVGLEIGVDNLPALTACTINKESTPRYTTIRDST